MGLSNTIPSLLLSILMFGALGIAQLSSDFYSNTCPNVTIIARSLIEQASRSDVRLTAQFTRLHFHDCFVNGCDGSVLLDAAPANGVEGEKKAFQNDNSLDGFEVIDDIKTALENVCPGVVSCADILSIAAEISVSLCGVIANRLHNFSGNNEQSDPSIEPEFLQTLRRKCPQGGSLTARVNLDPTSPDSFDNDYFKNLQNNRGVIESDQILFTSAGTPTVSLVNGYAKSQRRFFRAFAKSMIKMGNVRTLTRSEGEVRRDCRRVN
ncbi:unnamed protein product [Thlaspi arvense]|uniref:peroxidase n=1 Tax=Thlaspi arvense TaxID=13288 RepID=A0AAU9SVI7_THLAR|nr:unnamed protein product [Thlaspi arvense]